ncbi:MAG: glyoxalase/bleomycin resistance/dioxygenase family protein [Alphaproteobacteria bacterium]|nr:MAG: glyoxalase/bleomycin resistance/dioxygenase family protein [Alphaproteobacteria bacterium]
MKRLHIHVGVENLDQSIRFYNALFGAEPVKTKPDYAKWMLDSPHVNFAISTRTGDTGVNHLGIQVDKESELAELRTRLKKADMAVVDEGETVCCYARSDKSWVHDPAGIPWEAYRTMEDAEIFKAEKPAASGCGAPQTESAGCCAPESKTSSGECCS